LWAQRLSRPEARSDLRHQRRVPRANGAIPRSWPGHPSHRPARPLVPASGKRACIFRLTKLREKSAAPSPTSCLKREIARGGKPRGPLGAETWRNNKLRGDSLRSATVPGFYPNGPLLCHVGSGFTELYISAPFRGVEASMDQYLRGEDVYRYHRAMTPQGPARIVRSYPPGN